MMLPHPRVVKIEFRHGIEANIWDSLLTLKNVKEKVGIYERKFFVIFKSKNFN